MAVRYTKHECLHALQTLKFHGSKQLTVLEARLRGNFYCAWRSLAKKFPGAPDPHEAYAVLAAQGIRVVTVRDREYPELLAQSSDAPYMLYARGQLGDGELCTAFIGSRKMSTYGSQAVERIIGGLAGLPVCIVSGLAYGIDAASHRTALARGIKTIAVLGSGVDRDSVYPREHRDLADEIVAAGGAVVSEYPPGGEIFKGNFPVRNRIIAGLCRGVAVVQASHNSGSLITAREALDENRDLFAVPGSIFQETCDGTNALIASGAHVLRSAEDLVAFYPELLKSKQKVGTAANLPRDEVQQKILTAISVEGVTAEAIAAASNLPIDVVIGVLTVLEMNGYILANSAGTFTLNLTKQFQSN